MDNVSNCRMELMMTYRSCTSFWIQGKDCRSFPNETRRIEDSLVPETDLDCRRSSSPYQELDQRAPAQVCQRALV